jgi:MarR family 2-MHQ and catechol resistance regulon transcriptional repressor
MPRFRGPERQRLALNAWVKLARATAAIGSRLAAPIAAHDLSESQFGVLEALHHLGPLHQADLARRILRTSGNVTLVVDNLERRGLVARLRRDDDRRFVTVRLTPEGEALVRGLFPAHAERAAAEFAALTPAEQRRLIGLCRRLLRGTGAEAG